MRRGSFAVGPPTILRLDADSDLWVLGGNTSGQCGTGSCEDVLEPVRVELPLSGASVTFMAAMRNHCVVVCGGRLFASGGVGVDWSPLRALGASASFSPVDIPGRAINWVCCSQQAIMLCVDDDDRVYAHGYIRGICVDANNWVCLDALCGRAIDNIAIGDDVVIFRDAARHWWGYGCNYSGMLELGDCERVRAPVRLTAFEDACIECVCVSTCAIMAQSADRDLYCVNLRPAMPARSACCTLEQVCFSDTEEGAAPARCLRVRDILHSSLPARAPRTLVELAAQRVCARDIETAAARGLAGEGALVPPHILTYVRRIARAAAHAAPPLEMPGAGVGE